MWETIIRIYNKKVIIKNFEANILIVKKNNE